MLKTEAMDTTCILEVIIILSLAEFEPSNHLNDKELKSFGWNLVTLVALKKFL